MDTFLIVGIVLSCSLQIELGWGKQAGIVDAGGQQGFERG